MFNILASREALVFEFGIAEVDQQTYFNPGGVQIIDDLCLMFRGDGFDGFQFDDYLLFNEYIRIKVTNALAPERHLDRMLGYQ
jgi:hypothetical protein